MKADLTPITPAFRRDWHAFLFVLSIIFLLLLPLLIMMSGRLSARDGFLSMHEGLASFEHNYKEIYDKTGDLDVLFIGGSRVVEGIDTSIFAKRLRETTHKNVCVTTFKHGFAGEDLDYFQVSELLKRRKVHLVVWQTPAINYPYLDQPNPASIIWFMAQDQDMLKETPWKQRIKLYTQCVYVSLRDLLSIARPNPFAKFDVAGEGKLHFGGERVGFEPDTYSAPHDDFREFNPRPPQLDLKQIFYATNPSIFKFMHQPMGNYQQRFLIRAIELLKQHNVPLVLIHMPTVFEPSDVIEERFDSRSLLGPKVHLMGIQKNQLFSGLSPSQVLLLYKDTKHFNANGAPFFTNTVFQGLADVYQQKNNGQ